MKSTVSPLVWTTLALIAGILLAHYTGWIGFLALAPALPVSAGIYIAYRRKHRPHTETAFQATYLLAMAAMGAGLANVATIRPAQHVSHFIGQTRTLEGLVADGSTETPYGQKAVLTCTGAHSGKVMVYFPGGTPPIPHHTTVRTTLRLEPLPARNPGYARYLGSQGIYATGRADSITRTGRETGLAYHLSESRAAMVARLSANMPDPTMAGFATAMFLGDRRDLDPELRNDFSATGLSHILSISGMHVTLFYFFLNFLLGFMGRRLAGQYVRTAILLLALAGYMALTGLNPAVCRAVFMLATLRLSELFFLQKRPLNVLALSAFTFLVIDPLLIHDLGFQLSYLAVAGILLLEPRIKTYLQTRLPFLPAAVASAIGMTLAAQFATTPLVIWHFGQFPAYFLVANLVLLPVVTVGTYLGLAAVLLCWVPYIGPFLGSLLDTVLWVVASGSNLIASLPGAVARAVSFNDPGFCVVMGMVAVALGVLYGPQWILRGRKRQALRP